MKDKNGKEVHVFDKVRNDVGTICEITFIPEEPSEKAKEWLSRCELVEKSIESDKFLRAEVVEEAEVVEKYGKSQDKEFIIEERADERLRSEKGD